MKTKAIIGAAVGAIIGAVIWAVISATTGYEVGYVAWGIGLLVGIAAKVLGGQGKTIAAVCALLTLGSIFVGKMMAVHYGVQRELRKMVEEGPTRESYDEARRDAEDFAQLESQDDYPAYMVSHGFSEAEDPSGVTAEEIEDFTTFQVPRLTEFHNETPDFEEWRDQERKRVEEIVAELADNIPLAEAVVEDLGIFDIIFALLGLVTAYKMVAGGEE